MSRREKRRLEFCVDKLRLSRRDAAEFWAWYSRKRHTLYKASPALILQTWMQQIRPGDTLTQDGTSEAIPVFNLMNGMSWNKVKDLYKIGDSDLVYPIYFRHPYILTQNVSEQLRALYDCRVRKVVWESREDNFYCLRVNEHHVALFCSTKLLVLDASNAREIACFSTPTEEIRDARWVSSGELIFIAGQTIFSYVPGQICLEQRILPDGLTNAWLSISPDGLIAAASSDCLWIVHRDATLNRFEIPSAGGILWFDDTSLAVAELGGRGVQMLDAGGNRLGEVVPVPEGTCCTLYCAPFLVCLTDTSARFIRLHPQQDTKFKHSSFIGMYSRENIDTSSHSILVWTMANEALCLDMDRMTQDQDDQKTFWSIEASRDGFFLIFSDGSSQWLRIKNNSVDLGTLTELPLSPPILSSIDQSGENAIIASSKEKKIFWYRKGKPVLQIELPAAPRLVEMAPSGTFALVFDREGGVHRVTFDSTTTIKNKIFAVCRGHWFSDRESESFFLVSKKDIYRFEAEESESYQLAWDYKTEKMATSPGAVVHAAPDGTIHVTRGSSRKSYSGPPRPPTDVWISPDGCWACVIFRGTSILVDLVTDSMHQIQGSAWSRHGVISVQGQNCLVVARGKGQGDTIAVVALESKKTIFSWTDLTAIGGFSIDPGGRYLVFYTAGAAVRWARLQDSDPGSE